MINNRFGTIWPLRYNFFYHFRVMLLNAENNNIMIGAYEASREIKTGFGTRFGTSL